MLTFPQHSIRGLTVIRVIKLFIKEKKKQRLKGFFSSASHSISSKYSRHCLGLCSRRYAVASINKKTCLALFYDTGGRRIHGSKGEGTRLSTCDLNHFLPSTFHEAVTFPRPINDNDAMNGRTIWNMSLASHLFLRKRFSQEVNKLKSHWSSSECRVLHSTACFIAFCMEKKLLKNNQHCRCYFGNHGRHLRAPGRKHTILQCQFVRLCCKRVLSSDQVSQIGVFRRVCVCV